MKTRIQPSFRKNSIQRCLPTKLKPKVNSSRGGLKSPEKNFNNQVITNLENNEKVCSNTNSIQKMIMIDAGHTKNGNSITNDDVVVLAYVNGRITYKIEDNRDWFLREWALFKEEIQEEIEWVAVSLRQIGLDSIRIPGNTNQNILKL